MADHTTVVELKRLLARRNARNAGWTAFGKSVRRSALRMARSQDRGL
ncbi:hypothetical protein OG369_43030 [Streptomyces sp. NBC_01221]|nr:hypothetical protein [Streptomyces sp. NBC_01221]MCX4792553.1 hypothetical protein [Streptomyces sp. NBC_01221]